MKRITLPPAAAIGTIAIAALALTGCTAPADDAEGIAIVASTNVYGAIATAIAGDHADVTSIITKAGQDPHSYEATARDQLALSKADLVIANGGGYDPFVDTMLASSGTDGVVVLTATEASGLLDDDHEESGEAESDDPAHEGHDHVEGFNEHVWYHFGAMESLAGQIATELGTLDPDNAADYDDNYAAFSRGVAELTASAATLREAHGGEEVAITEPVPLYLFEAVGLVNRTPDAFSEAIEEGTDVTPAVLLETLDLIDGGHVRLLAYNEQTAGPETEKLLAAAEAAGIAVLPVTETLPDGSDYLSWMGDTLTELGAALD